MDLNYCKPLASILQDAQGMIDPDTGLPIDIGGHVVELRQICDRLRAELAECREDAERYRWLRKIADMDFFEPPNSAVCNAVTPEHLDEIIDAALAMNDAAREGEGEA